MEENKNEKELWESVREEVRWRRAGNDRSFVIWWALARGPFNFNLPFIPKTPRPHQRRVFFAAASSPSAPALYKRMFLVFRYICCIQLSLYMDDVAYTALTPLTPGLAQTQNKIQPTQVVFSSTNHRHHPNTNHTRTRYTHRDIHLKCV